MCQCSDQNGFLFKKSTKKKFPKNFYPVGFYEEILEYETRAMSMRPNPKARQSMEMLFRHPAKWNWLKAAKNAGLTNKEMKITFNEYCRFHQPTWEG